MTPTPIRRHELTDNQWERLQPLLPPEKPMTGRPNKDHRIIINGMLWIKNTGAPWRDLPERYGSWKTVSNRFYRWRKAGIWDKILAALQQDANAKGNLQWAIHYIDGTIVRAHQHAAGAKGGHQTRKRLAAARAGSARKSTYDVKGQVNRSCSNSPQASSTKLPCSRS